ncbi:MAG: trypsin-like peptidase domain-containing protein, partial [Pyrinomonadaceae bacterium]|nr:trypsin-like peptidase domain-containing protein [Phycisphaerales bacterium]
MSFAAGTALIYSWNAAAQPLPDPKPAAQPTQPDGSDPEDVRKLISHARDSVFPALVNIEVVSISHYGGKEVKQRSTGSGTIISPEGYILTNAHVTNEGAKFWCTLSDKRRLPGKLIGEDPFTDLAVLQIDKKEITAAGSGAAIARFGDSDALKVGDYVMAMGSPFSLSRTVTLGVVSNTERVFTSGLGEVEEMTIDGSQRTGLFTNWIQHDA